MNTLALDPSALIDPKNLLALVTLTVMEIVLGIDNIVFIAIIAGKLPVHQREKARLVGLSLALITRIALLTTVTWIMSAAKTTLFSIPYLPEVDENGHHIVNTVNGKDLILLLGGAFLIFKATREIHHNIEGEKQNVGSKAPTSFWSTIFLILVIDLVFSIDSVVTAVGMARSLEVMITAVVISVIIMLAFSGYITRFIDKHKTLKMLALSFLLLIGVVLVADGLGQHINKGYIYFAMAFSVCVEMLNMKARPKHAA